MHKVNPRYWLGAFRKPQGFRPQQWLLVRLLRGVYMPLLQHLAAFRTSTTGERHVPRHGGVIVAANHPSSWDPLAVFAALDRNVAFIAKAELWRKKPLRPVLNWLGHIPVDRGNRDSGALTQATALAILRYGEDKWHRRNRGGVVAMFPEGGLTDPKTGKLKAFKKGVYYMARESGRPVVPCGISGTDRIRFRGFRGFLRRRPQLVYVRFGAPLDVRDYDGPDGELRFMEALREQIELLRIPEPIPPYIRNMLVQPRRY